MIGRMTAGQRSNSFSLFLSLRATYPAAASSASLLYSLHYSSLAPPLLAPSPVAGGKISKSNSVLTRVLLCRLDALAGAHGNEKTVLWEQRSVIMLHLQWRRETLAD